MKYEEGLKKLVRTDKIFEGHEIWLRPSALNKTCRYKNGQTKVKKVSYFRKYIKSTCENCFKECFQPLNAHKKGYKSFCTYDCVTQTGDKNSNWRGGVILDNLGYRLIHIPTHPNKNNKQYVYEHRLVIEENKKRILIKYEAVHHDGIKYPLGSTNNRQDNRLKNLILFKNRSSHIKYHAILKKLAKALQYPGLIQDLEWIFKTTGKRMTLPEKEIPYENINIK